MGGAAIQHNFFAKNYQEDLLFFSLNSHYLLKNALFEGVLKFKNICKAILLHSTMCFYNKNEINTSVHYGTDVIVVNFDFVRWN